MNVMSISFLFCFVIPVAVLFAAWVLGQRTIIDREKSSPFECGFDPSNSARLPFSMRFFLLAIIFIVFDIEIVLLTPIPLIMLFSSVVYSLLTASLFLSILVVGLVYEWKEGSLDWSF
uniref:NADH-ubiquinone oxidoreductase chain 3 n=1 Tax=Drawida japonica TaxID=408826 RepID=A0A0N6YQZ6_9ANNE|nr:NADH dehydrogenase subunit 3 [Drawida japonica]AIR76354.1 NADH dehydrogenase subunit 3 [Drawida japonica]